MRNWILGIVVCALLVASAGCVPASEDYKSLSGNVLVLTENLDDLQNVSKDMVLLLEKAGIVNEDIVEKVEKANEKIDENQAVVTNIATSVKDAPYTGDNVQDLIIGLRAANAASAPVNPYAIPIAGFLAVAELVTGFFLVKKSKEAKTVTTRLEKTNEGISKFEGTESPDVAGRLHDIVKAKTANT
jgi:uncharacterized protein YoxC